MNINYENRGKTDLFCNIPVGECFIIDVNTPDQSVCMKVWGNDPERDNAVDLQDGEILSFEDGEIVMPVKAKLYVRLGD